MRTEKDRIRERKNKRKYRQQEWVKERERKYAQEYRKKNIEKLKDYYENNKSSIISYTNKVNQTRDSGLLYKYLSMRRRCTYKSQRGYRWYGARGITVEWNSYKEFRDDMYDSYMIHLSKYGHKQTTLDRINPDGNYCKSNCRWATIAEQHTNKRKRGSIFHLISKQSVR